MRKWMVIRLVVEVEVVQVVLFLLILIQYMGHHGATSPNNSFVANFHAPTSRYNIDLQSGFGRRMCVSV